MNMKSLTAILTTAAGLFLTPSIPAADNPALMESVKSVLDRYLKVQTALAKDSLKDVAQNSTAIAKAVNGDPMKMLPVEVAKQAEGLAKAQDLKAAREAFKPLSASLIKYLADTKAGQGAYHEGYCPMVKAGWLQTDSEIRNPYMGSKMLTCGTLKN